MTDEEHIRSLLERAMDSEQSPEEVCRERPEFLPEVRARWQRLREVQAQVEALFPTPSATDARGSGSRRRRLGLSASGDELPRIPGYEVQTVLGMGGMGVVYKARHLKLKRTVAIKMVLAGAYATPAELACLVREAAAVAGLRHANIVQVHDVGELDGLPYFTMEYVEGGSLAQKLGGVPQPARDAAQLLEKLASAVGAAHRGGIVHRDLKPANILLTSDGIPKIADFSLARQFGCDSSLTFSSARVGTPSYMAPEQAMGKIDAFCPSVDIYALGAILYEALTGRPPFRAETPTETQRQVVSSDPVAPSRLNTLVPRDLETICLKCLQKDPQRRYPTVAALADDLDRFIRREPITARRAGPIERASKWVRRHPAAATAIVAGALISTAAMGGGLWLGWERAIVARAVNEDLQEVDRRILAADWREARVSLDRAEARLGAGGSAALRDRVAVFSRDLDLVDRLAAIWLNRAAGDADFNRRQAEGEYEVAFKQAGLAAAGEAPGAVAARIAASQVRAAIVAAVDDWAICAVGPRRDWLLEIARTADPDPRWRDRVRNTATWSNGAALAELASTANIVDEPVPVLLVLVRVLDNAGGDAIGLAKRIQAAHPADFWANIVLGELLDLRGDPDAIGYYRAALAARPDAMAGWVNLGVALMNQKRSDEAVEQWRHALALDPNQAILHNNIAAAAINQGHLEEAINECRETLRLEPRHAQAYTILGQALFLQKHYEEAQSALRRAMELAATDAPIHAVAAGLLERCDRELAMQNRLPALLRGEAQPADAADCLKIAETLTRQKNYAAAERFYSEAFARSPTTADDLGAGNRYNAACCAAILGSAGPEGLGTGEERVQARERARGRLRADLAAWAATARADDPAARTRLRQTLEHWQIDPDLASLRDADELAKLPAGEREQLVAFWNEVEDLRARSASPK